MIISKVAYASASVANPKIPVKTALTFVGNFSEIAKYSFLIKSGEYIAIIMNIFTKEYITNSVISGILTFFILNIISRKKGCLRGASPLFLKNLPPPLVEGGGLRGWVA
jgi:hypothetical protein